MNLTRISRKYAHIPVAATLADGQPATLAGVDIALLPVRGRPDAATTWTAATYANAKATVLLAGPDAAGNGALVVADDCDLWARVTDTPEVDAALIGRITVI